MYINISLTTSTTIREDAIKTQELCEKYPEPKLNELGQVIMFETIASGFNNQLLSYWEAILFAQETKTTIVLMDLWPDWTWEHYDYKLHRPFETYFSDCVLRAHGVNAIKFSTFQRYCHNTLDIAYKGKPIPTWAGYNLKSLWKHEWMSVKIKKTRYKKNMPASKDFMKMLRFFTPSSKCIGLFPLPSDLRSRVRVKKDVNKNRFLPYFGHVRYGRKSDLKRKIRSAFGWSPKMLMIADAMQTKLNLHQAPYLAIHVRKGDFSSIICKKRSDEIVSCPSNSRIIRCIQQSTCRTVFVASDDVSFVDDIRAQVNNVEFVTMSDVDTSALGPGEQPIVEQIISQYAYAFVGVAISSFSGTIMSGRDLAGIPYNKTLTWMTESCSGLCGVE